MTVLQTFERFLSLRIIRLIFHKKGIHASQIMIGNFQIKIFHV